MRALSLHISRLLRSDWNLQQLPPDHRVFTIESSQFGQTQFALGKSSGAGSPSPSFPSHDNYDFQEDLLMYLPRSWSKPGAFSLPFLKVRVMPAFFQSVSGSVHLMKPIATVLCSLFLTKDSTLLKLPCPCALRGHQRHLLQYFQLHTTRAGLMLCWDFVSSLSCFAKGRTVIGEKSAVMNLLALFLGRSFPAFLKEQLDYAQTLSPPPATFVVTVFTPT